MTPDATLLPRRAALRVGAGARLALAICLAGMLHWVAAAFGVNGFAALLGDTPNMHRLAYLGLALAALFAMAAIVRAAR